MKKNSKFNPFSSLCPNFSPNLVFITIAVAPKTPLIVYNVEEIKFTALKEGVETLVTIATSDNSKT